MKVSYSARGTLLFSFLAFLGFICLIIVPSFSSNLFKLNGVANLTSFSWYLSTVGYIFGHTNVQHLIGNMSFILLLGPLIELKFGARRMLLMILITAILTGLLHTILWDSRLIGASGIVFMFIVLSSLLNLRQGEISLTFILIVLIFLGREIYNVSLDDNVSQFTHLFGGVMGVFFGFYKNN